MDSKLKVHFYVVRKKYYFYLRSMANFVVTVLFFLLVSTIIPLNIESHYTTLLGLDNFFERKVVNIF